jgi:hypothetical protein
VVLTDHAKNEHPEAVTLAAFMELVGRETELASVDRAVQEARSGDPRALGLFGEPGIQRQRCTGGSICDACGVRARQRRSPRPMTAGTGVHGVIRRQRR